LRKGFLKLSPLEWAVLILNFFFNLLASSKFNSNCLTISELFAVVLAVVQNNVDSRNIFCTASCIQLHVFFLDSHRSILIFFALLGSHLSVLVWNIQNQEDLDDLFPANSSPFTVFCIVMFQCHVKIACVFMRQC
jgi:hypothetical protein